jgi:hypothetical protein
VLGDQKTQLAQDEGLLDISNGSSDEDKLSFLEQKLTLTQEILAKKQQVNTTIESLKDKAKGLGDPYETGEDEQNIEIYTEAIQKLNNSDEEPTAEEIEAAKGKLEPLKTEIEKLNTDLTGVNAEIKKVNGGSNESVIYEEDDAEAGKMATLLADKKRILTDIVAKKEEANKIITGTPLKGEKELSIKDDQEALSKAEGEVDVKTTELVDQAEDAGVDPAAVQAATEKYETAKKDAKDANDKVKALPILADKIEDEEKKKEILDQIPAAKKDAEQKEKVAEVAKAELDKVLGKEPKPKKENESKIMRFADYMESKKRNG